MHYIALNRTVFHCSVNQSILVSVVNFAIDGEHLLLSEALETTCYCSILTEVEEKVLAAAKYLDVYVRSSQGCAAMFTRDSIAKQCYRNTKFIINVLFADSARSPNCFRMSVLLYKRPVLLSLPFTRGVIHCPLKIGIITLLLLRSA